METLTTTEVQRLRGLANPAAARSWLHRHAVTPVGRHPVTDEKLWPADQVHAAIRAMPGPGWWGDHSKKGSSDE